MKKPLIAVFGANPAWQKTLVFDAFSPGEVNRARSMTSCASGKGVNFCRAVRCAGICDTRVFQFSGGGNGEKLQRSLEREKLAYVSVETENETRVCASCIDRASGAVTECIEPSAAVSSRAADEMLEKWEAFLPQANACAITGSLPDGTDPALYRRIAERVFRRDMPLLIDAVSGIGCALREDGKFILKVNARELRKLAGGTDAASALKNAAGIWRDAVIAVTDGADAAFLAAAGKMYRYALKKIDALNPIGAGDTCAAVMLSGLLAGKDCVGAFAGALAAASAGCLDPRPGFFDPAEAAKLMPEIKEWKA
ncbi:MAG: PfkB family carbohydrate kinase [Victivallaceae bacterium]|nr:PfkB family carbohydrate kinase [Victivallaceae bacterium]